MRHAKTREPRDYELARKEIFRAWGFERYSSTARAIELQIRRRLTPDWHSPQCLGLFVQAGSTAYPSGLSRFLRLWEPFRRLGNPCVVVDNLSSTPPSLPPGVQFLPGSNACWEFSGWQEGLNYHLNSGGAVPEWCVCVTSAFVRKRLPDRFSRFLNPISLGLADQGLIGNFLDMSEEDFPDLAPDEKMLCRGRNMARFAVSAAFAVSGEFASRHGFVAVDEQEMESISPAGLDGTDLFPPSADVSMKFRVYINDWLQHRWYGSRICDRESRPLLRGKLQAMLNERILSVRVADAGLRWSSVGRTDWITGRSKLSSHEA